MDNNAPTYEGYAVLELMGHRRLIGRISEATIGGASFIRIDVPIIDGQETTQFYSPHAVYCITPTTEEIATRMAHTNSPAPVSVYEMHSALSQIDNDDIGEVLDGR